LNTSAKERQNMTNLRLVSGSTIYLICGFGCLKEALTLKDVRDILVLQNLRPLRAEEWTSEVEREAGEFGSRKIAFLGGDEPRVRFAGGGATNHPATWDGLLQRTTEGVNVFFPAVPA
jgi:hypothetical protein